MKKIAYILIIILFSLYSCTNERNNGKLIDDLIGVNWENSELDFIQFDSTLVLISLKNRFPPAYLFEYSLKSDTLIVINKTINAYNLIDFDDSISYLKVKHVDKERLEIELLNVGAKKLFDGFEDFEFYNSDSVDRFSYYVEKDSSCLQEINLAKDSIENGIYVLCIYPRWPFRQEKEFAELLERNGIKYKDLGPAPDVLPIARNCYRETMDYCIERKFGSGFIQKLMLEADSIMVYNNPDKIYKYYECDDRPRLPSENKRSSDYLSSIKVTDLKIIKDESDWGGWPFFDVGFRIEKDSTISDFYINYWVAHLKTNEKFKDKLFEIAVNHLKKKYPKWVPGKVLGIPVRTDSNVRIFFEKE